MLFTIRSPKNTFEVLSKRNTMSREACNLVSLLKSPKCVNRSWILYMYTRQTVIDEFWSKIVIKSPNDTRKQMKNYPMIMYLFVDS